MTSAQGEYLNVLDEIHHGLAVARRAARVRRGSELVPGGPGDPGGQLDPRVAGVLTMMDGLVRSVEAAPWSEIDHFPNVADGPRMPLRIGTARVGVGPGRSVHLPVLVPLLGAGHLVINHPAPAAIGTLGRDCPNEVSAIVDNVVLRALATTSPRALWVIGDEWMPSFLDREDIYRFGLAYDIDTCQPGHLPNVLARLRQDVDRIQHQHLAGRYDSLEQLAEATEARPEPWRLLILSRLDRLLNEEQMEELLSLLRSGPACGIHAILIDSSLPSDLPTQTVHVSPRRIRVTTAGPLLDISPDPVPLPGSPALKALDKRLAAAAPPAALPTDLLPAQLWTESSRDGLIAPISADDAGTHQFVRLGDSPPHALVGGPSGAGKTNFLHGLLMGFAARYSPDEVEFYLLDFKEGVSVTSFAPQPRDPSWLPHARLIGVNINNDREFGLAMLRHLAEQLRTRSTAVKRHGASDLKSLRATDPGGRWPRIVAVIDEFQFLLASRDGVTEEAAALLEDLARRGRSFGIHLVLASQEVASIEALWGRSALVAQLTLRVALPKAVGVLAANNDAADHIPEHHVVINHESGALSGNQVVRLPNFDESFLADLQARMWPQRDPGAPAPTVFDGDDTPQLDQARDFRALRALPSGHRVALLGRTFDVTDRAAATVLGTAPGRNLAVIGTRPREVHGVLASATTSIARQCRPGDARFAIVIGGSDDEVGIAAGLHELLHLQGMAPRLVERTEIPAFLNEVAAECRAVLEDSQAPGPCHYISFVGVDAASVLLRRPLAEDGSTGHEVLRQIVNEGPETGTHLLAWWRSAQRLKDDLSDYGSRLDDQLGVWVALDAHGDELAGLPGAGLLTWHPRAGRALWFDRVMHSRPQILVPFEPVPPGAIQ